VSVGDEINIDMIDGSITAKILKLKGENYDIRRSN